MAANEFSISGQRDGHHITVTWREGEALTSSDHDATARWMAQSRDCQACRPRCTTT